MYAAMFTFVGYVPMPLSERDYISLMPVDERTIQKDGVEFGRRTYDSPVLAQHRSSGLLGKKKYELRYRPNDPSRIWVYIDQTDEYVACDWRDRRVDTPHSRRMWDLAAQVRSSFHPLDPDEGLGETISLIQRAHRQWKQEAAKAERAALAEHLDEVQGRTAREGRAALRAVGDEAMVATTTNPATDQADDWSLNDWEPDEAFGIEKEV